MSQLTEVLRPETPEAWEQACKFVQDHGKLSAICNRIDEHVQVMKEHLECDYRHVIASQLDRMLAYSNMIRKSTELSECFDVNDKMFYIYDYLTGFDQSWHFGTACKSLFGDLETMLYEMYDIVEMYETK